jgi:site-specific DNA recombinase
MRAAGYIRVSTQEQADKGWNLGEDRRRIEEMCAERGWEPPVIYDDGGRQGDDPDRPGLRALLDALDDLDVVILRSQDRISRDIGIWAVTSAALRTAGVKVETFKGPLDLESPAGEFMANVMASVGKFEKRQTGQRVRQALDARVRAGLHTGGAAPCGYRWEEKLLVVVSEEAEVVRHIFIDYVNGMGQRAIVRGLAQTPTRHGGPWHQSAVSKILSSVTYIGKLKYTGEVVDARHEPIVDEELWNRAQAIRASASRRKGGRHLDGAHLLTRGLLRCPECGSAMIPRKARQGVERERYVCSGRVADRASCSQPSIRRELIDEPFLAHLLDGYIDLAATKRRIEERTSSALARAREAVVEREAEVASIERALATTERDYDAGDITGKQYSARQTRLSEELEGAQNALQRARHHIEATERGSVVGDGERVLLDHLAALKAAASAQAEAAPDQAALRNVIGEIFEEVRLAPWDEAIARAFGDGPTKPSARPWIPADDRRYWLLPKARWSAVDSALRPIPQPIAVPEERPAPRGKQHPSPRDNRIPTGSCAGTAGGSPRRSRTVLRARSRS